MARQRFLVSLVLLMLCMPFPGAAHSSAVTAAPTAGDANSLLSAFMSYTDLRMRSVQQSLEILAATSEARSGSWSNMHDLLKGYQESDDGFIVWYARPDGTYYTVGIGLMDKNLRDRIYFPALMDGMKIMGDLVISKATGERSAIIAVPVEANGKIVGAVGVSLFLDKLSEQISADLDLRPGVTFFALAPNGLTTLNRKADRQFLDPREQGSETLKRAATEMLAGTSGMTTYEFDGVTKNAIYRTSALTGWKYAIAFSAAPAEDH
jgi:hypothetical protein